MVGEYHSTWSHEGSVGLRDIIEHLLPETLPDWFEMWLCGRVFTLADIQSAESVLS